MTAALAFLRGYGVVVTEREDGRYHLRNDGLVNRFDTVERGWRVQVVARGLGWGG